MSHTLSEQKVLKKLGIDNFRQLSKKKVLKLASMIHEMDPEVAKKALEQFPEFEKTALDVLTKYNDSFERLISSSEKLSDTIFASHEHEIKILEKELDTNELSFEERMVILDRISNVNHAIRELRREIAQERLVGFLSLGVTAVTAIVASAAILGVNLNLPKSDDDEEEYEEV